MNFVSSGKPLQNVWSQYTNSSEARLSMEGLIADTFKFLNAIVNF